MTQIQCEDLVTSELVLLFLGHLQYEVLETLVPLEVLVIGELLLLEFLGLLGLGGCQLLRGEILLVLVIVLHHVIIFFVRLIRLELRRG